MSSAPAFWGSQRADVRKTQLENLRRSLQLTDRILSERDNFLLRFSEEKEDGSNMGHNYGVTLGNITTLNVEKIPNTLGASGIANILGLNYHELSHFMLSPSDIGVFRPHLGKTPPKHWEGAYAILEEHRIETLMGARYPSMRKYFAHPILSLAIPNIKSDQVNIQHLLLHGRRFLPRKIRDTFSKFFENEYGANALADVNRLIDAYRFIPLNSPADQRQAADIIGAFAKLLENLGIEPPTPQHTGKGQQSTGQPNAGNKTKERQEREQMARMAKDESDQQDQDENDDPEHDGSSFGDEKEEGEENERDEDAGGQPGEGSDDADSESGGSEGDSSDSDSGQNSGSGGKDKKDGGEGDGGRKSPSSSGGNKSGSGNQTSGKTGSSTSTDKPGSQRPSAGSGKGNSDKVNKSKPKPETYNHPLQINSAAKKAIDELLGDSEVQEEISRYQAAMDQSQDGLRATLSPAKEKQEKYLRKVTSEMFRRSGAIASELRQIWAKMDAGWNYGVDEGARLNMMNAAMATEPEDYETIYDDWSPGQQDNAGLEVVILGDGSSSMSWTTVSGGRYNGGPTLDTVVSQNIWELMYALQEVEARVTVLTYDGDCYTFYDRSETVNQNGWYELNGSGGTNPLLAHQEARRILSGSEMPNKLLVNFTDGEWYGDKKTIAATLDPLWDVTKVAALLGGYTPDQFAHREAFDIVKNTSGDILDIMADAVKDILLKSGRN